MYYLNFFYQKFLELNLFLPLSLIFTIIVLLWILRKPVSLEVKINNFILIWIYAIMYINIYCLYFFILRIFQTGNSLDLKIILNKLMLYFVKLDNLSLFGKIIINCIIIILILLWLIIVLKTRKILGYKTWQLYLYTSHIFLLNDNKFSKKFYNICNNFHYKYSFDVFCFFLAKKFKLEKMFPKIIFKLIIFFFLIFIFILECYINNFTLYYIFFYLPIYMLIIIWVQISEIISNYNQSYFSHILIERAYGTDIIYVNLTEKEENLLKLFIENPLKAVLSDNSYEFDSLGLMRHSIEYNCKFKKMSGEVFGISNIVYYNENISKLFELEKLEEIDGKYFVDAPENPEAMEYYKKLKNMRKT